MKKYEKIKEYVQQYGPLYFTLKRVKDFGMYSSNRFSDYGLEKFRFYRELGYWPNIRNPRSFNEKILWKKIYDRNPLLPVTADKYRARSYIREVLGKDRAEEILIPLLYVTDCPEEIPFEKLPENFIIKPNHTSGTNIMIEKEQYEKKRMIQACRRWLQTSYGLEKLEWAYQPIPRKIIIEKLLREEDGRNPREYRFYMFYGKCRLVYVILDRINDSSRSFFDADWNFLPVRKANRSQGPFLEKPKEYEEMLKLAEKLSGAFDFVRVDFYLVQGKIYAGELTHYPTSGKLQFEPKSFDFELGQSWEIRPEYWKMKENKRISELGGKD